MLLIPLVAGTLAFQLLRRWLSRSAEGIAPSRRLVLDSMLIATFGALYYLTSTNADGWPIAFLGMMLSAIASSICFLSRAGNRAVSRPVHTLMFACAILSSWATFHLGSARANRAQVESESKGDEILERVASYLERRESLPSLSDIVESHEDLLRPGFSGTQFRLKTWPPNSAQVYFENNYLNTCTKSLRGKRWVCSDGV